MVAQRISMAQVKTETASAIVARHLSIALGVPRISETDWGSWGIVAGAFLAALWTRSAAPRPMAAIRMQAAALLSKADKRMVRHEPIGQAEQKMKPMSLELGRVR